MRKATGFASKLHRHTQYKLLGAIDLNNITRIRACEMEGYTLFRIHATDGSSLVFPDATDGRTLGDAVQQLLKTLDDGRHRIAVRIATLLQLSAMDQCGACERYKVRAMHGIDGEKGDASPVHSRVPQGYMCTCVLTPATRTTSAQGGVSRQSSGQGVSRQGGGSMGQIQRGTRAPSGRRMSGAQRRSSIKELQQPEIKYSEVDLWISLPDLGEEGLDSIGGLTVWKPVCIVLGLPYTVGSAKQKPGNGKGGQGARPASTSTSTQEEWVEIDRTEVNHNMLASRFRKKVTTDLLMYKQLKIEVHLYNNHANAGHLRSELDQKRASAHHPVVEQAPLTLFYGEGSFLAEDLLPDLQAKKEIETTTEILDYDAVYRGKIDVTVVVVEHDSAYAEMLVAADELLQLLGQRNDSATIGQKFAEVTAMLACLPGAVLSLLITQLGESNRLQHCFAWTSVKQHVFYNRSLFEHLEAPARLAELDLDARFELIRSFKRKIGGSGLDLMEQKFVVGIFEATEGHDLFDLKDRLDVESESVVNMSQLVHVGVADPGTRAGLLKHFATEGKLLVADPAFVPPLRILSDIDDTLVHSGLGLGGPKYKPGTVLPGFVSLVRVLNARVAFVTARPQFVKHMTYKTLRDRYGIHDAVCLFGELKDSVLIPFAKHTADRMVADRKMANIDGYLKIFPECKFVWFGDSGQGDMLVGDEMNKAYGTMMTGVYIQDVVKKDGLTYSTSKAERAEWCAKDVHVVDNYAEVANHMFSTGLLGTGTLLKISIAMAREVRVLMPQANETILFRAFEHEAQFKKAFQCVVGGPVQFSSAEPEIGRFATTRSRGGRISELEEATA